ncbi:putative F-box protein At1g47790 [Bidens hawaiensis]|uniref:putative F-box protein At1g47790 n=1 Tax=Bidens hawaiensis TaxID=980011 RepID=UPI00404A0950
MHKGVMIKSATDILKQKKKQKQDFINKHRQKNPDNQQHIIGSEISSVTKEAETESGDIIIIDNNIDYDDILLCHILPKVPAESIIRFKSVSKGWHSFLTTPMFAQMHQEHHQNSHKLLFISNTTRPLTFSSVDCEKLEDGFTSERHFPFEVDCPQDMTIITSFNGLVCVGIKDKHSKYELKYSRLILWNPPTGDYKTLSKTNAHEECYKASRRVFVLCYVSSEDYYKLLRVTKSCNVYIYSLKSDSWRNIEQTEEFHRLSCSFFYHNALLNDKLYVLKKGNADLYSVMRLDLKTGKLTEAETPFSRKFEACLGFTVRRGCIHVWMCRHSNRDRYIDLWRMDGDGHGDWIRVVTFYETVAFDRWFMQPLHLMADGKWLMLHNQCLYITNPEKPNRLM